MPLGRPTPRLDSFDPELGLVRTCGRCGEVWPRDPEFFYFGADGKVIGHCRACWHEARPNHHLRRKLKAAS